MVGLNRRPETQSSRLATLSKLLAAHWPGAIPNQPSEPFPNPSAPVVAPVADKKGRNDRNHPFGEWAIGKREFNAETRKADR